MMIDLTPLWLAQLESKLFAAVASRFPNQQWLLRAFPWVFQTVVTDPSLPVDNEVDLFHALITALESDAMLREDRGNTAASLAASAVATAQHPSLNHEILLENELLVPRLCQGAFSRGGDVEGVVRDVVLEFTARWSKSTQDMPAPAARYAYLRVAVANRFNKARQRGIREGGPIDVERYMPVDRNGSGQDNQTEREGSLLCLFYSWIRDADAETHRLVEDLLEVQRRRGHVHPLGGWCEVYSEFLVRHEEDDKDGARKGRVRRLKGPSVAIQIRNAVAPKWSRQGERRNAFDARLKRIRKRLKHGFDTHCRMPLLNQKGTG